MIYDDKGNPLKRVIGFNGGDFKVDENEKNKDVLNNIKSEGHRDPVWRQRHSGWQTDFIAMK